MNKTILFRRPTSSGDFACANGEIASAENVRLRLADGSQAILPAPGGADAPALAPSLPEPATVLKMPAPPVVRFALQREVVGAWHNHIDNLPATTVEAPSKPSAEAWGELARKTHAEFERDAEEAGLFTRPFFVLSAVRLPGGERVLPSMPVLMVPQRSLPYVAGSDNLSLSSMQMRISAAASRLRMCVTLPAEPLPDDAALEVLVSGPISCFREEEWISYRRSQLTGGEPQAWRPRALTEIAVVASMLEIASFRPVSMVPIADIAGEAGVWRDVELNIPPVADAEGNFYYRPDYGQLQDIQAAGATVISKRVTAWDLTLTLPAPPAPAALVDASAASGSPVAALMDMEMMKEGRAIHSVRFNPADPSPDIADDKFPSWLFLPDRDIRSLTIMTPAGGYRLKLTPHPTLNGSFFCCGDFQKTSIADLHVAKLPAPSSFSEGDPYESRPSYRLPDAVWRSGPGSSLFFPDNLLMRVDDSRIIAICRAFRASGLVATTAPTAYLFTTGGIYLLREMDDGSLRDAGLIAAYVLGDPSSIKIDGRTLSFTDTSGTPYVISGTTVKPAASTSSSSSEGSATSKNMVIIEPDGSGLPIHLMTRPLKLDPTSDLFSFELLGACDASKLTITLHGSADLCEWSPLAVAPHGSLRGVYLPGLRYARLELSGPLDASLEGVAISTRKGGER